MRIAIAAAAAAFLTIGATGPDAATPGGQRAYETPQLAAQALYAAARDADFHALEAILGPGSGELIASGNEGEDMADRARFVAAIRQDMHFDPAGPRRVALVLGTQGWQFPYPLVRDAGGWRFDAVAGRAEVVTRRIARNELSAVQALLECLEAQRIYAGAGHDGAAAGLFAQRIASSPEAHDGLYWPPARDSAPGPLGGAFTLAAADGGSASAVPYHGYFFRMLRAQGRNAPGGAADYVAAAGMGGGFAIVAWPARHRVTGLRTFMVSQHGAVYGRDLGSLTESAGKSMVAFDPSRGWKREVAAAVEPAVLAGAAASASRRGCLVCHRDAVTYSDPGDARPLAPPWREIAWRYRADERAERRLMEVVLSGADPQRRHWQDRLDFTRMEGNASSMPAEEARALVRWILATP